jgi:hypothetical protein
MKMKGFEPNEMMLLPFTGSFDGDWRTISNLYINRPIRDNIGFFGQVNGGEITGISLTNINLSGQNKYRWIIGLTISTEEISENINISIINVTGNITGSNNIGGVIGKLDGIIAQICDVSGICEYNTNRGTNTNTHISGIKSNTIISGNNNVGGSVGTIILESYTTILDSSSNSFIDGNSNIGGFVGFSNQGHISKSFVQGYNWNKNVGVCRKSQYSKITNSYTLADVT